MEKFILPETLTLTNPQDLHLHLRGDLEDSGSEANKIMQIVTPLSANFSRILAMPNVMPDHIKNAEEVLKYKQMVENSMREDQNTDVIYTISLKPTTTPETIIEAKEAGIKAVKYYPGGVTTNSGEVSGDLDITNPKTYEVLQTMQEEGIVLSLHPETTLKTNIYGKIIKGFVHYAEREFKSIIEQVAEEFPKLKIVVEHISTKENAELLASGKYENVYGTITPQHLTQTAHDKEGFHGFNTHLHCKPTLKNPEDQEAIWKLILSGNNKIFLGSDSAPHPTDKKEAEYCAAGVFSSPIVLEIITNWFFDPKTIAFGIDNGLLLQEGYGEKLQELLQNFVGKNGNQVYGELDKKFSKKVILEHKDFTIPEYYGNNPKIKPMWAGKPLAYIVSEIINS